jgi:hypothetical protein
LAYIGSAHDIAGLQCGITYQNGSPGAASDGQGIDIFDWTLCASLEFPSTGDQPWPEPGSGNLITWSLDHCQTGVTAVAGYFYLGAYGVDQLRLIPRPIDNLAKLAHCNASEILISPGDLGVASFSSGARIRGCNPAVVGNCEAISVRTTTWSGIKTIFR